MSTDGILEIFAPSEIELGWANIPHRIFCGYPIEKVRFLHVVDWRFIPHIVLEDVSEKSSVYGQGSSTDEEAESYIEATER